MSLGVALKHAFVNGSELPAGSVRVGLLAECTGADLLQLKSARGDGVPVASVIVRHQAPLESGTPSASPRHGKSAQLPTRLAEDRLAPT
jgi:hypothetical protein